MPFDPQLHEVVAVVENPMCRLARSPQFSGPAMGTVSGSCDRQWCAVSKRAG